MGSDLGKEAQNVVTETRFKTLMHDGFGAEIVCRAPTHKRASVWYGEWIIRAVSHDRAVEQMLVSTRSNNRKTNQSTLRLFKTINGLVSFLRSIGFSHITVPMEEGGRSTHILPNQR